MMVRRITTLALTAVVAIAAVAQDAPSPEQCLAKASDASALSVVHGGRTYYLATEACRAQFAADPERYSQLYDALLELAAEGTLIQTPATPSLVPS